MRLATPPPPSVMVNGHSGPHQAQHYPPGTDAEYVWYEYAKQAATQYEQGDQPPPKGEYPDASKVTDYYFEKVEDRTNIDTLIGFFLNTTHGGEWYDHDGKPAEVASVEEASAIVNATLQTMVKTATSPKMFLINLGALAGARVLMTRRPKYYRMLDGDNCHNYKFEWAYRFGELEGDFTMTQSVPWTMFRRPPPPAPEPDNTGMGAGGAASGAAAVNWKEKCMALNAELERKERELTELRTKVITTLR